jgi:hypothetical protein
MKNLKMKNILLLSGLFLLFSPLFAQVNDAAIVKPYKNVIGLYFGMIEYNINYERNIIQHAKSQTNLRVGFGYLTDLQVEGRTLNGTIVQMFGKHNSHLELNLGEKYFIDKSGNDNFFLTEVYAGYRHEKQNGRSIFRIGLCYPSFINIGFGLRL